MIISSSNCNVHPNHHHRLPHLIIPTWNIGGTTLFKTLRLKLESPFNIFHYKRFYLKVSFLKSIILSEFLNNFRPPSILETFNIRLCISGSLVYFIHYNRYFSWNIFYWKCWIIRTFNRPWTYYIWCILIGTIELLKKFTRSFLL